VASKHVKREKRHLTFRSSPLRFTSSTPTFSLLRSLIADKWTAEQGNLSSFTDSFRQRRYFCPGSKQKKTLCSRFQDSQKALLCYIAN